MASTQYLRILPGEQVRVGGAPLPGIVSRIRVEGELELEKKPLESTDGEAYLPHGFRSATVTITITILPPNEDAQVKSIEGVFRRGAGVNEVRPYRLINPHLDARGVTRAIFTRLTSEQGDEDDRTMCELTFLKFEDGQAAAAVGAPTLSGPASGVGADSGDGGGGGGAPQAPSPLQAIIDGRGQAARDLGGE